MLIRILIAASAILLMTNLWIAGKFRSHRTDAPSSASLFEGKNSLYEVNLWRAQSFTPAGQRWVRWYAFTLILWIAASVLSLLAFVYSRRAA